VFHFVQLPVLRDNYYIQKLSGNSSHICGMEVKCWLSRCSITVKGKSKQIIHSLLHNNDAFYISKANDTSKMINLEASVLIFKRIDLS